jgi:hypothetical protein
MIPSDNNFLLDLRNLPAGQRTGGTTTTPPSP